MITPHRLGLFWKKTIAVPNNCIIWIASTSLNGYGKFWFGNRLGEAHRFAYEAKYGEIPRGLTIDHLCRNRLCVNPNHLEAVTQRENLIRGIGITAQHAAALKCPQGHLYNAANTYLRPDGKGRDCKTCRTTSDRLRTRSERRRRKELK